MKLKGLLWGACACAVLAGCSNDEVVNGNESNVTLGGDSYVAIQLVASNGAASRAENGGFDNGYDEEGQVEIVTVDESKVAAADFYFYKGNTFVKKGEVISDLQLTEGGATANIESTSNVMVVLKNVTETPDQVLVVLNGKDVTLGGDGATLSSDLEKLVTSYKYEVTTGEGADATTTQYFLMSNSSYVEGSTAMCATPIEMRHLQSTEELAKKNPVEIYVERVAAKVQLKKDENFSATIDGNVNVDDVSKQLTIEVNGWGLSGTNKNAYCMKKIASSWSYAGWSTGLTGGSWNDAANHRSYWAQDNDYNTGEGKYPENYDGWTTNGGKTDNDQNSLNYLTYNDLVGDDHLNYDDVAYCFENTMDASVAYNQATGVNNPAVTHLLIAATLKVSGTEAQDLFRYQGEFFTKDNYIAAALNVWKAGGNLIYRVAEADETGGTAIDGTSYISVTASDVEVVNKHDGKVSIQLTDEAKAKSWYTISGETATEITADKEATLAALFEGLNDADGFKGGSMYYCVPIEHLNNSETIGVGSYGVVRNHFYQLTLESIKNIGTAVYDPEEVIIPNYEPETYWVAARLNVLSWKVVNQSVNL